MITRFRLEATGTTKEDVQQELSRRASSVIILFDSVFSRWEVTHDVISKNNNGTYSGRIVYKLKE